MNLYSFREFANDMNSILQYIILGQIIKMLDPDKNWF